MVFKKNTKTDDSLIIHEISKVFLVPSYLPVDPRTGHVNVTVGI